MTTKYKNNFRGFTLLNSCKANLTGLTLIEVIISITILILILFIVYSSYTLSIQSYVEGENIAEITQNGRVILERLSREIRQAKEIVTDLTEDRIGSLSEIKFHDGHLSLVSEEGAGQGGTDKSITLAPGASSENDYYKDMFIKITGGTGAGQIGKIYDYDGTTKIAEVDTNWLIAPDSTSIYKIDSSFYYVHYYLENNNFWRKIVTYCFSADSVSCVQPETYVSWDSTPSSGQSLLEFELETPQIVGEYLNSLEFWGSGVINIYLILEKSGKSVDFQTKIFGRNI